jgi:hypothetical protein
LPHTSYGQVWTAGGTFIPKDFLQKDKMTNSTIATNNIQQCLHKTVSIVVHLVLDSAGKTGIVRADLDSSLAQVNRAFSPICLQFKICKTDTIHQSKYNEFDPKTEEQEMLNQFHTPNMINWYFVEQLIAGESGYTFMPGGYDAIFMKKSCLTKRGSIIHQMGHFFGLYDTSETLFGTEQVKGANCSGSGDLICDTEADPYPNGILASSCDLSTGKDAMGNWYLPPLDNYMSRWESTCTCRFTTAQYNRIIDKYLSMRNYLW